MKTYTCTVCGATRTESIPALVAPVQTSTASSESNTSAPATTATPQVQSGHAAVYFTCTACGYHNWTATEGGYACDHCGAVTTQDLSAYANVKGTPTAAVDSTGAAGAAGAVQSAKALSAIPQTGDDARCRSCCLTGRPAGPGRDGSKEAQIIHRETPVHCRGRCLHRPASLPGVFCVWNFLSNCRNLLVD
ncbi:MAG: hypothetical protein ACLUOA_06040 [Gemmiger formicilis]|uniref:hypothetical protein n=1 Tax=Gemmiger formicilis TaxID=745368 RepID=UPI0039927B6D